MDLKVPSRPSRSRVSPERRTPVDLIVSAAIVMALVAGGAAVWWWSPARQTTSVTTDPATMTEVEPATAVPESFTRLWQADSPVTSIPVVTAYGVATAGGSSVVGHDPGTGREVWRYSRGADLCAIAAGFSGYATDVLAAYRNSRGCGEITALDAATGRRDGARSSDADDAIRLTADSGYALALGDTRLETWGTNLVRGIEYGRVDAPVKPDVQPRRSDCELSSGVVGADRLAVIERCASDPGYRLSVLGTTLDKDENVNQYGSTLITNGTDGPPPTVIAMSSSAIAVYDGGADAPEPDTAASAGGAQGDGTRSPTIRQFSTDGQQTGVRSIAGRPAAPEGSAAVTAGGLTTFWTGTATVVLDAQSLSPIYQVPGTLGPGEIMDDALLLPSVAGVSVRDPATGREIRSIELPRTGEPVAAGDEMVALRVLGDRIVEQFGDTVTVFGPAA